MPRPSTVALLTTLMAALACGGGSSDHQLEGWLAISAIAESGEGTGSSPVVPGATAVFPSYVYQGQLEQGTRLTVLGVDWRHPATYTEVQTHSYGCDRIPTDFAVVEGEPLPIPGPVWLTQRPEGVEMIAVTESKDADSRSFTAAGTTARLSLLGPTTAAMSIGDWSESHTKQAMDGGEPELNLDYPIHVPVPVAALTVDGQLEAWVTRTQGFEGESWGLLRRTDWGWETEEGFGLYWCAF